MATVNTNNAEKLATFLKKVGPASADVGVYPDDLADYLAARLLSQVLWGKRGSSVCSTGTGPQHV